MTNEPKQISRQIIEEVFNDGRLDLVDEIVTANFIGHDPALPQETSGPAGLKELVAGYRDAFPDIKITIDDQIAEGDRVVTRWTARGTHKGDLWGIGATGKEATITGTTTDKIENGHLVESWSNWDTMGLMQQLGVIETSAKV
jgi:steroid delta-isomerase-like uncharacterized protein